VAALPHKPWELSWRRRFDSKVEDCDKNTEQWLSHISRARTDLNELIETTLLAKGDSEDIEIARNALADDNAPAVLRALARIEAESIDIEVEEVRPDGITLKIDEDEIPFVDLSSEEEWCPRVALIKEIILGDVMAKKDGGGIQQAAGLIRYFDEESEDAWKITPRQIYLACIGLAGFIYLVNEGVVSWIMDMFWIT